jgi:hypothetical protein
MGRAAVTLEWKNDRSSQDPEKQVQVIRGYENLLSYIDWR